jgi:hypothetical protein
VCEAWYYAYVANKFKIGKDVVATAGQLKKLGRLLTHLQKGEITYRTYLAKRRNILGIRSPSILLKASKKGATPWKKIRIFGGGLPELGKR